MEQDDAQAIRSFAEAYTAAWCSQDAASVAACLIAPTIAVNSSCEHFYAAFPLTNESNQKPTIR